MTLGNMRELACARSRRRLLGQPSEQHQAEHQGKDDDDGYGCDERHPVERGLRATTPYSLVRPWNW